MRPFGGSRKCDSGDLRAAEEYSGLAVMAVSHYEPERGGIKGRVKEEKNVRITWAVIGGLSRSQGNGDSHVL